MIILIHEKTCGIKINKLTHHATNSKVICYEYPCTIFQSLLLFMLYIDNCVILFSLLYQFMFNIFDTRYAHVQILYYSWLFIIVYNCFAIWITVTIINIMFFLIYYMSIKYAFNRILICLNQILTYNARFTKFSAFRICSNY